MPGLPGSETMGPRFAVATGKCYGAPRSNTNGDGMGRAIGAGAIVLVAMAGAAHAAEIKCARPPEVSAIQAAAIQQDLMVAALTCNQVSDFNTFQTNYKDELRASDARLLGMFHRIFGFRRGEAEYHAFKTRLANDSSMRSIHNNPDYCREASLVFASALAPEKPSLDDIASGVQVTEESPVDSCEIRVAGGLKGTAIPTIVPVPNPARVAQLTPPSDPPAADAPPASMTPGDAPPPPDDVDAPAPHADATAPDAPAPDQSAAMQAPEPGVLPDPDQPLPSPSAKSDAPAAQPVEAEKKDDSGGWLSGITSDIGSIF